MPGKYDDCTEVTDFCVVEATTYGFYPNLGANAFLLAIFALCMAIQFFQGIKWRSWSYMIAMTVGCLGEVLGPLSPLISCFFSILTAIRLRGESHHAQQSMV